MSKNPSNPTNSAIVQALLDAKDNGFPATLIDPLLDYADKNKSTLKASDTVFKKRNYPKGSISWSRIYNDIEIEKFLTPYEFILLVFMIKNMWTNNLIQVSQTDIVNYTCISSKGGVNKAIHSLISKGCIAVKYNGNNRQKAVYMVNPMLGTVGVEYKDSLAKAFWELTGTKFGDKEQDTKYSEPHKQWQELTMEEHYYRGRNSRDNINFNEIKERERAKKSKTDTTDNNNSTTTALNNNKLFSDIDAVTDELTENLPF